MTLVTAPYSDHMNRNETERLFFGQPLNYLLNQEMHEIDVHHWSLVCFSLLSDHYGCFWSFGNEQGKYSLISFFILSLPLTETN